MHICRVELKNGKKVSGIVWTWRPKEGWFDLVGVDDGNASGGMLRILLRDVASAVEENERVGILKDANGNVIGPKIEDVDLLKRAKDTGWNGE